MKEITGTPATFEVQKDFLLNGEPFQIRSGAVHYFRIPREDWEHSLYNLKALGFNTVETYVPWNMHEPKEGEFHFEDNLDLDAFIQKAGEMGLHVIVRPSPFICAEWEFGGMPAWLLNEDLKPRSRDPKFLNKVQNYYNHLLPILEKNQLSKGGPILMFQVENEYGSYATDKEYLKAIAGMMKNGGLEMPFFTSDGPWNACLESGSLIEEDILPTGNFGSRPEENFAALDTFIKSHGREYPLMCMEFWDGWFGRYKEPLVHRDPQELAQTIGETLKRGSLNLYMFHGGTNFGFMNGCSSRKEHDLPQLTSYDYGAPLSEQGNPSPAWYAIRDVMNQEFPEIETMEPRIKEVMQVENIPLARKTSLFENLPEPVESLDTLSMEKLGQNTGYVLYETTVPFWHDKENERLRIIDGRDRVSVFSNGNPVVTQYQEEIGSDIQLPLTPADQVDVQTGKHPGTKLQILAENMGRVNYGAKLLADTQKKGIRTGVMADLHFLQNWKQYPLPLDSIENIDFDKAWHENQPGFYQYDFELESPKDTWLDISNLGKGVAYVNGRNIGRYWNVGPLATLYVPGAWLRSGKNTITLFETDKEAPAEISLIDHPVEIELDTEQIR